MSSDDLAISVGNLSKCYHIYNRPSDRLRAAVYPRLQRFIGRAIKSYGREFWALADISFEAVKGETIGIIGSNGSGKSTLLQLICGTLSPTAGRIETHGRIAALLELGSGFNLDFTGRENVYMNAALLGLSREEIDYRFDQIAAFADIGEFLEQSVKTYSSGMLIRLAFAVIAHVDADILVVDEALAVGDAVFTQKCMRFIRNFQDKGTLLFVSHDIGAVQGLCKTGIWLKNGRIERYGTAKKVTEAYFQFTQQQIFGSKIAMTSLETDSAGKDDLSNSPTNEMEPEKTKRNEGVIDYDAVATVQDNLNAANGWKTGQVEIISVSLTRLSPGKNGLFEGGDPVRMTIRAKTNVSLKKPILGFLVRDRLGQNLFGENTLSYTDQMPTQVEAGGVFEGLFEFHLPMLPNGQYAVTASIADGDLFNNVQHHWMHDALILTVASSKVRYGLMGISFNRIELGVVNEQ